LTDVGASALRRSEATAPTRSGGALFYFGPPVGSAGRGAETESLAVFAIPFPSAKLFSRVFFFRRSQKRKKSKVCFYQTALPTNDFPARSAAQCPTRWGVRRSERHAVTGIHSLGFTAKYNPQKNLPRLIDAFAVGKSEILRDHPQFAGAENCSLIGDFRWPEQSDLPPRPPRFCPVPRVQGEVWLFLGLWPRIQFKLARFFLFFFPRVTGRFSPVFPGPCLYEGCLVCRRLDRWPPTGTLGGASRASKPHPVRVARSVFGGPLLPLLVKSRKFFLNLLPAGIRSRFPLQKM